MKRWPYILCLLLAAAAGGLSYPVWRSGFAQQFRPALVDMTVTESADLRVYWEDPAVDPDSFAEITNAAIGTFSRTVPIQRSKRGWGRLVFVSSPAGAVEVSRVEAAWGEFEPAGRNEFRFPRERWTVPRQAGMAAVVAFLAGAAILLGALRLWSGDLSRGGTHAYLLLVAVSLSAFWTAVFFPALMSEDSVVHWEQALQNRYFLAPPPLLSLMMRVAQGACPHLAFFTFLQGVLFWYACFAAIRRAVPGPRAALAGCFLFAANPALWTYSATLWKDVWIVIVSLPAVTLLGAAVTRKSGRMFWGGVLLLALTPCFRATELTLALTPLCLGWFVLWAGRPVARRALRAALVFLVFLAPDQVVKRLPVPMTDNTAAYVSWCSVPPYVGVVGRLDRSSPEYLREEEEFDRVFGAGTLAAMVDGYDPREADCLYYYSFPAGGKPIILPPPLRIQNVDFLRRKSLSVMARHPVLFLRHKLNRVAHLLQGHGVYYPYHRGIRSNSFGAGPSTLLPSAYEAVYRLLEFLAGGVLFRHYLYVALLAAVLAFGLRRGDVPALLLASTGFFHMLGFVAVDANPEWRYLLLTYVCAVIGAFRTLCACVPAAGGAESTCSEA